MLGSRGRSCRPHILLPRAVIHIAGRDKSVHSSSSADGRFHVHVQRNALVLGHHVDRPLPNVTGLRPQSHKNQSDMEENRSHQCSHPDHS